MENSNLKKFEEAELKIVMFDFKDVVLASGGCPDQCTDECADECIGDCRGHYCEGYCEEDGGACLAAGTEITMADGTVKKVEDICEGDNVLAFNHEMGCYVASPILYAYKGDTPKCAFTIHFSNNKMLSIVDEHDLFEQESCRYETITDENAEQFIGKHFYSVADKSYVKLVSVTYDTKETDYYELYTEKTLNLVANGMLNVADDVTHWLNIYEFNADLSIDKNALIRDIQQYGLVAFSKTYGFTQDEFDAWNMRYTNISIGKGLTSFEELWSRHYEYLDQKEVEGNSECA